MKHNNCLLYLLLAFVPFRTMAQEPADTLLADTVSPSWSEQIHGKMLDFVDEAERSQYTAAISIYDLTDDSMLFAYNQQKMMRPASTQKLLTAISALDLLGASHNYTTRAVASGSVANDSLGITTLNGNIYIIGDFDPKLDNSHIKQIASAITSMGVRRINGGIYADLSMKDTIMLGNGWCWDDTQPFLTPLSLSGTDYKSTPSKINRHAPSLNFLKAIAEELSRDSIAIDTLGISSYRAAENDLVLCRITHSIGEILQDMMKESDNLYAESMFFQLAAGSKKGIGWKDCATIVESVIQKAGVPVSYAKVADGSGLSLYNYLTASLQVALLRYAHSQDRIFNHLYHSLPIASVDGTLKSRMEKSAASRNVHAKTGTVTGVSSLAGYLTASNGHLLAFSIICNGVKTSTEGRSYQDRICIALCE